MAKLSDLTPDASNANRGTQRGRYALEASLRKYGAGRSILLDKDGRIVAGNKTAEVAGEIGIDDVIIVQTDGTKLVAVQRTDLDIDSPEGRGLAYADNRVGEIDLDFSGEQLAADLADGLDLSDFWREDEIDALIADADKGDIMPAGSNERALGDKARQIKPVLYADEISTFERAILATGERNRGAALIEICRFYLEGNAERQLDL